MGKKKRVREWSRENIGALHIVFGYVCVGLQNVYYFSCICILYGSGVKSISVAPALGSGGNI